MARRPGLWNSSDITPPYHEGPRLETRADEVGALGRVVEQIAEAHLVVVDGFLREDLSTKAGLGDVVAVDLFSAVEDVRYNKIIRKYLARYAGYHNNGLTARYLRIILL